MFQPNNLIKVSSFVAFALALSCNNKTQQSNVIEINGNIKGLTAKMAYITDNYPIDSKPFDSCKIVNGTFSFKFKPDTVFSPRLVYISYNDPKFTMIGVNDPYAPKDGKPHRYGDFILERGITELTGDFSKDKGVDIKTGTQNDFYFKNYDLPFAGVSKDSVKHKAQVNAIITKIKEMPDSYWAAFAVNNLKFSVTKAEMTRMFNAFDQQTRQAYYGKKIKSFLADKLDENALKPNALLTDDKNNRVKLIDSTKKVNMVVFWASWCGPCRLEIPTLKKLAAKYKNTNLRMVSVSIDKDKTQWKQALDVEKMQWQQLCIDNNDLPKLTSQYNLGWIPQVYLIDNNRKIIKHVDGFDPANEAVFDKTIADALKTN